MPNRVDRAGWGEVAVESLRRHRAVLLVGFDLLAIAFAYVLTAAVRYDTVPDRLPLEWIGILAGVSILVHLVGGQVLEFHKGRAAVGSVDETTLLMTTAVLGALAAEWADVFGGTVQVGRTVPVAASVVALCLMIIVRAAWRASASALGTAQSPTAKRALVVGAGDAGKQLVRSTRRVESPYVVVALLDDDKWMQHRRVFGIRVRGHVDDLVSVAAREHADLVIVAIPTATGALLGHIQDLAAQVQLPVKVLPSVAELLGDTVSIRDVRDINMADVLGRKPVQTDIESIAYTLAGKRVLVTGAGGSIGSELCRQIYRWDPAELMMLDRDESALHGVQLSIYGHGLLDTDDMVLCDIRDDMALNRIFQERRPEVVFHAAALKHLPMLEQYPSEAIKSNVLGTINVLEAAQQADVGLFVNISTDKAADPTSVLGLSKCVAERITADVARSAEGTYISVRFGNVLGSRGSVLTAWAVQIDRGGPITVTHPNVTRYFMTVAEACQLVLQAGAIGRDGEVLILDMGEPVKLDDVAKQLIAQSGKDIKIVYTGLRPGEKMDEILLANAESGTRPFHPSIAHVAVHPLERSAISSATPPLERDLARITLTEWAEAAESVPIVLSASAGAITTV